MTPYKAPEFAGQKKPSPPPPDIIDQIPEYEVEEILNERERRGKREYFVHWKGYPREERTWEPIENLANAQRAITDYHKKNPSKKRRTLFEAERFCPQPTPPIIPQTTRPRQEDDPDVITDPEELRKIIEEMTLFEELANIDPAGHL